MVTEIRRVDVVTGACLSCEVKACDLRDGFAASQGWEKVVRNQTKGSGCVGAKPEERRECKSRTR